MNDDFEKRLHRVTSREVPSAWREEVLSAARHAAANRAGSRSVSPSLITALLAKLSALSRPQRAAWAGIATIWLLILAMNVSNRDSHAVLVQAVARPSLETLQAVKQQKLLLAELVGSPPPPKADRPKSVGPHSCRPTKIVTT